jgi:hypothetical protein
MAATQYHHKIDAPNFAQETAILVTTLIQILKLVRN